MIHAFCEKDICEVFAIEKMMHAKYLSEVRGGNKRIPQCHIQKDWQDYLFAIVQFLCVCIWELL